MKALIEKWRARAAVEARQCIADVYLECAHALEKAEDDRIHRLAIAARVSDEALTREIMRDCYQDNIDPAHALPAERL